MGSYWMQLMVSAIEQWMTPLARYLTKSRYLVALRDGFQLAMPFVIVGVSACHCCIRLLPDSTNWLAIIWNHVSIDYRESGYRPYQINGSDLAAGFFSARLPVWRKGYGFTERLSRFNRFS